MRERKKTGPRSFCHTFLLAAILSFSPGRALAHAIIVESTPAMNGVVTGPALEIKLRFNARIDGSRSKLTLISPDGISHAVRLAQQTSPDALSAQVSDLAAGKYQLHWQVLASDGHITQGNIPFTVVIR
jgi:copper resistance protein C